MLFTFRTLEALKPAAADVEARRYVEHFDTGTGSAPGLAVRVAPSGKLTFTFHYSHDGKRARMDLGKFPAFTLADARNAVGVARVALEAGRDPRDVKAEAAAAAGVMSEK